MGISIDVQIDDKVLQSVLGKIGDLENLIVRAGTIDIFNYARLDVPVDTGFLRSSISRKVSGSTGVVEASAPYALYVEVGTSIPTPAQPYLRPAVFKTNWSKIVRLAFKAIGL